MRELRTGAVQQTDAGLWAEIATPSNPPSASWKLYFKNDGNLYKLSSLGVESQIGGGGGGANTTLSNLGVTAINADLIFDTVNSTYRLKTANTDGSSNTKHLEISSGAFTGAGAGTNTGNVSISTGSVSDNADWSGNINITTGTAANTGSGGAILATGTCIGSGPSGTIGIQSGSTASGTSGQVTIQTGTSSTGSSGNLVLTTGVASGGTRGVIQINTRYVDISNPAPGDTAFRPTTNNTVSFGTSSLQFSAMVAFRHYSVDVAGTSVIYLSGSNSSSGGTGTGPGVLHSGAAGVPFYVETVNNGTADAVATNSMFLKTGNKTAAGNTSSTGNIDIVTGTNSGTGASSPSGSITIASGNTGASSFSGNVTIATGSGGGRGTIIFNSSFYQFTGTNQNQTITPTGNNAVRIGTSSNQFYSSNILFTQSQNSLDGNHLVVMSGNLFATLSGGGQGMGAFGSGTTYPLTLITQSSSANDAIQTLGINLLTGNKTGGSSTGNSGSINLQTGTVVGGTRGSILLNARSVDFTNAPVVGIIRPLSTLVDVDFGTATNAWQTVYTAQIRPNTGNILSIFGDGGINYDATADKHDFASTGRGIVVPRLSADPGTPEDGEIWYNTTSNQMKARANGTTTVIAS